MGSLNPQLPKIAEMLGGEIGSFSHVFGDLYGKIAKNWSRSLTGTDNFSQLGGQMDLKMVIPWIYRTHEAWIFDF